VIFLTHTTAHPNLF